MRHSVVYSFFALAQRAVAPLRAILLLHWLELRYPTPAVPAPFYLSLHIKPFKKRLSNFPRLFVSVLTSVT